MISREQWSHIHALENEKEADRIERDCIDPQLREGRVFQSRGVDAVASLSAHQIPNAVLAILLRRAKAAGWCAEVDHVSGWLLIKL